MRSLGGNIFFSLEETWCLGKARSGLRRRNRGWESGGLLQTLCIILLHPLHQRGGSADTSTSSGKSILEGDLQELPHAQSLVNVKQGEAGIRNL